VNWSSLSGTKVAWCGRTWRDEVHQVLRGVAFDVVFAVGPGLQQLGQLEHVVRADVALIGPGVHGDALRTGLQAQRWPRG
jgi:hypothetical protein